MKKLVLFIMLLFGVVAVQAREPYGDYICPYIFNPHTGNLQSFFDAKEQVRNSFQQINAKQMEAQKNRRPVGFTTNTQE